ncbi:hypothetical protein ACFL59_08085 [Planctomycetota bacterium]
MPEQRHRRTYDHRLRELVRTTGDVRIATKIGVPRSTAVGWLCAEPQEVVTLDVLDTGAVRLQAEVLRLRRRMRILGTVVGLLLAFRVAECFEIANTVAVLLDAARGSINDGDDGTTPKVVVDGGVENFNGRVDELIEQGVLRRLLALTDLRFSNSMIEAFWKSMKHQWLYLHSLDSVAAVSAPVDRPAQAFLRCCFRRPRQTIASP